jgi:excisionase family DNA binding protein
MAHNTHKKTQRPAGIPLERASGLLKKREIAAALGISPRTIDDWITAGKIPYIKASGRLNLFRLADVMRALEKLKVREVR